MIICLVRHAESVSKIGLSDAEKADIGLSDLGRLQARAAAKKLQGMGVGRLFSSPMARSRETAQIISAYTGIPIEYDERLREFSADLNAKDPAEQRRLKMDSRTQPNKIMPGGESFNAAVERLENVIRDAKKMPQKLICIVTHRVILEGFLAKVFNVNQHNHEWMRPASISAIEIKGDKLRLLYYDRRVLDLRLMLEVIKRRINYMFD